ncbi:MAG: NAD(P)-binding protein [Bacilli bacterium]
MKTYDTVILGAGISGIAASLNHNEAIIYEKSGNYGGLCGSFEVAGFKFDYAVHLSFTNNNEVRKYFDQVRCIKHFPLAMNYYKGYWLKHPIQNNLFPLPTDEKIRIINSFMNRSKKSELPVNYQQWLEIQYGTYFTKEYVNKYTNKYWCKESVELSIEWIGNRIHVPTIDEVLFGALEQETPNAYYASEMRYPLAGGFFNFIEPFIDIKRIKLNHEAILIDLERQIISFSNNEIIHFKHLISSIPLPELINKIKNSPIEIRDIANKLEYTSIYLISIGFKREIHFPALWFYVYDEDIKFARAYSPSLKSKNNVPNGKSSIQLEVYFNHKEKESVEEKELINLSILSLEKMGIATAQDIEVIDFKIVEYGNVIFSNNIQNEREKILDWLDKYSDIIKTVGRFGEWDYLWSDQSFISGYNAKF